jgi:hypothetical protein
VLIESIGNINSMEDITMTRADIYGVQLPIVNITAGKNLSFTSILGKCFVLLKTKHTHWHARNAQSLAHLPMLFMGKLHQFFKHMALLSQNSVNTNQVKYGVTRDGLDI